MSSSGFGGKVTNTSLPDIIQLICIGRNTCRMRVRSGRDTGWIFFREGEIVHAEKSGEEGPEAFFGIVAWERGAFECDETPTDTETIQESWDFLLMESMRRLEAATGE